MRWKNCTVGLRSRPIAGRNDTTFRPPLHGFTLVELLVVITIIAILIALLLPAVQAAREAARLLQCQNNMKQVGLAVLNYESQYRIFPPSAHWDQGTEISNTQQAPPSLLSRVRENWAILVLPFLEQQALYDRFDLKQPIAAAVNALPRSERLAVMLCPSDAKYNQRPFMGSMNAKTAPLGDNWARGNYGANASLGQMYNRPYSSERWYFASFPDSYGWKNNDLRGVMGANISVTMSQITDGASNTCLLGELRAGVTDFDTRCTWAMSSGASALWMHGGMVGDDYGPNCPYIISDDAFPCREIRLAFGNGNESAGAEALVAEGMPCFPYDAFNVQQTARSLHRNGVNLCFCDGSVHFITDFIQVLPSGGQDPNTPAQHKGAPFSVWDRLMASADGWPAITNSF